MENEAAVSKFEKVRANARRDSLPTLLGGIRKGCEGVPFRMTDKDRACCCAFGALAMLLALCAAIA